MSNSQTGRYRQAKNEVFIPFWVPGWNLVYTVVGITITMGFIGYQVGLTSLFGMVGIFVAPLIWFAGTRYVQANYEPILEGFREDAANLAEEPIDNLGPNTSKYTFKREWDSRWLLTPFAHYRSTTLLLGDNAFVPLEMSLHMNLLNFEVPVDPPVIPYEDITSVDYRDSELVIGTKEDEEFQVAIEVRPDEAISELRDRIEAVTESEDSIAA
mgnify:CR=1 FL=1